MEDGANGGPSVRLQVSRPQLGQAQSDRPPDEMSELPEGARCRTERAGVDESGDGKRVGEGVSARYRRRRDDEDEGRQRNESGAGPVRLNDRGRRTQRFPNGSPKAFHVAEALGAQVGQLLREVDAEAHVFDRAQLGFQPVDVLLFVGEDELKELP